MTLNNLLVLDVVFLNLTRGSADTNRHDASHRFVFSPISLTSVPPVQPQSSIQPPPTLALIDFEI